MYLNFLLDTLAALERMLMRLDGLVVRGKEGGGEQVVLCGAVSGPDLHEGVLREPHLLRLVSLPLVPQREKLRLRLVGDQRR